MEHFLHLPDRIRNLGGEGAIVSTTLVISTTTSLTSVVLLFLHNRSDQVTSNSTRRNLGICFERWETNVLKQNSFDGGSLLAEIEMP